MENSPLVNDIEFAPKAYGGNGQPFRCMAKANLASLKIKKDIIYHYTIEINMRDNVNNERDKKRNQKDRLKQQKKLIDKSNFEILNTLVKKYPDLFRR